MSRILKAYRTRFHQLLRQVRARRVEQGVDWLVAKAKRASASKALPLARALSITLEDLVRRPAFRSPQREEKRTPKDIFFFCDAGLGGLARWLRAAGYRASWEGGIDDNDLVSQARRSGATILTTDSMLMERRLLRDKIIPSFWMPPTLSISEQLQRVFREFQLSAGSPLCMSCSGELLRADKQLLRQRIPPKTFLWQDEYFLCSQCGKLFWHGTHWLKIRQKLNRLAEKESA